MPLEKSEQVHDFGRDVVDHFLFRPAPAAEEDTAHADKGLGIDVVRDSGDPLDQAFRQGPLPAHIGRDWPRSEEHPSELQSLRRSSSADFRLTKKTNRTI